VLRWDQSEPRRNRPDFKTGFGLATCPSAPSEPHGCRQHPPSRFWKMEHATTWRHGRLASARWELRRLSVRTEQDREEGLGTKYWRFCVFLLGDLWTRLSQPH
jgi:hypothetical protein